MEICVIGAGYVGLVTSACLAYFGNRVTAVDADKEKVARLSKGEVPFFEPHLQDLVAEATDAGLLSFSDDTSKGASGANVIFISVGTPPLPNGDPDLSQVMAAARAIGAALDPSKKQVIVNKSTVPVGSGNWVEMLVNDGVKAGQPVPAGGAARTRKPAFMVVSNPEFLREGNAIFDTLYPDRIVIGSPDEAAVEIMKSLYEPIIAQNFTAPAFAPRPEGISGVPLIVTDLASAEMIKYSANAFLAMKISFANEIANLCEKVGADIRQVAGGIGFDQRIGPKFLNAGVGWGGSCFGKDLHALMHIAHEYNCPTSLLDATVAVNQRQRLQAITKLQEELKIIKGRTIGLLGLTFKPNTDDLRDAPSLTIAAQLHKMGAKVAAYDPIAGKICAKLHPELPIVYCGNAQEAADGADALILVTEWEEFQRLDWKDLAGRMRNPLMIDGRNFLPESVLRSAGFVYRGMGT